nr:hypothetical protein [Tanacetum cinerariifolium]
MSTIKFAETHNLVAFLEKSAKSEGFEQIVEFLNANPIKYALKVNHTIYTSCIQQFWDSAKVKTVNEDFQIRVIVDGKKLIINEASIRRDLKLEDTEGTACLPNDTIFEELARMSTMASTTICLANNQNFNFSKYIFDNMVKNLEDVVKFFMFPRFVQVFVDHQLEEVGEGLEVPTDIHHTPIVTKPLSSQPPKKKKSKRKQRKKIEVPHTKPQTEESVPTTSNDRLPSGRMNEEEMFGVDDLEGDEILIDIKAAKSKARGVIVQELGKFQTTSFSQPSQLPQAKDKGKGIMVEPEKPLKKKDQTAFDEEVARNLEAQMKAKMEEEKRITREKDKANIAVIE